MYAFDITASSRVGCIRDNNEDMILVGNQFIRDNQTEMSVSLKENDRFLFALADGMGGHNCGEVASSDVLHNLQFFYNDMPTGLDISAFNEAIFEWLNSMNIIIDLKGRADKQFKNMGTTLVALAYYEGNFYWLNCGDSRLYRLHEGKLIQMTTDHSLSNMMGSNVHSHIITNCIGGGCTSSYIDIVQCTAEVESGDTFILCSDGLTDMVNDISIESLLNHDKNANDLCMAAEVAGGKDNVSVVVCRLK
jgi:protein phosphatase